jgi:hypothetical protein
MAHNPTTAITDAMLADVAEKCAVACRTESFPSTATYETRILTILRERLLQSATPSTPELRELVERFPNGTAADALDYALDHIKSVGEMRDFLEDWRDGRFIEDWRGYIEWLELQRTCAAESRANRAALSSKGGV